MKPKPIGIIGGAGPQAGVLLLERVFTLATDLYGCHKDNSFPLVRLLSFPFTEMLEGVIDREAVSKELASCIEELKELGSSVIAIACNTLHLFLKEDIPELVHMPKAVFETLPQGEKPLVLCTTTSAKGGLHNQFFPCRYPDAATQKAVDWIIDETLKGKDMLSELAEVVDVQGENTIVLGCTELSLYTKKLLSSSKKIIDPLEVVAEKVVKKSFVTRGDLCLRVV